MSRRKGELVPADGGECRVLARLGAACRALAEAKTADDLLEVRDQAKAVADYLKRRDKSLQAALDAAEIKLRAERRLGELLARDGERRGGNSHGGSSAPLPTGSARTTRTAGDGWRRCPRSALRRTSPRPARPARR